jgi:hypothetical protein
VKCVRCEVPKILALGSDLMSGINFASSLNTLIHSQNFCNLFRGNQVSHPTTEYLFTLIKAVM